MILPSSNSMRTKVFAFEGMLKQLPQAELPLNHYFCDGMYARELIIPKDAVIVGKIHKFPHFVMVVKGELSFLIGDEIQRMKAPFIVKSEAGAKRAIWAHEDSVMITVHLYEGEIDKADECLVFDSQEKWLEYCKTQPMLPLEAA